MEVEGSGSKLRRSRSAIKKAIEKKVVEKLDGGRSQSCVQPGNDSDHPVYDLDHLAKAPQRGINRQSPRSRITRIERCSVVQHLSQSIAHVFDPMPAPPCSTDVQASRELGVARRQVGPNGSAGPAKFWPSPRQIFGRGRQTLGQSNLPSIWIHLRNFPSLSPCISLSFAVRLLGLWSSSHPTF